jgi:hypothetical protein
VLIVALAVIFLIPFIPLFCSESISNSNPPVVLVSSLLSVPKICELLYLPTISNWSPDLFFVMEHLENLNKNPHHYYKYMNMEIV